MIVIFPLSRLSRVILGAKYLVSQKKLDQVCGEHFNKTGHSQLNMLPVSLEEVTPKNDDFLRLRREEFWIRNYQSIFGANKHSWSFLDIIC